MTRPRRQRGPSVQSPLETYLREINETALLSADEEKQLAHLIDIASRQIDGHEDKVVGQHIPCQIQSDAHFEHRQRGGFGGVDDRSAPRVPAPAGGN